MGPTAARIVHQDVDTAEMLDGGGYRTLDILVAAYVAGDRQDLSPGVLANVVRGSFEDVCASRTDGHLRTFLAEPLGGCAADAFAAPGDDRDLAYEFEFHASSRWSCSRSIVRLEYRIPFGAARL